MIAAKLSIVTFASGAYVMLAPVDMTIALVVLYFTGFTGNISIRFLQWNSGLSLTMTVMRYKGWKALYGAAPPVSRKMSIKPPKLRILTFVIENFGYDYLIFDIIVTVSLSPISESTLG